MGCGHGQHHSLGDDVSEALLTYGLPPE